MINVVLGADAVEQSVQGELLAPRTFSHNAFFVDLLTAANKRGVFCALPSADCEALRYMP